MWPYLFKKLQKDTINSILYELLLETDNMERIYKVFDFAKYNLPFRIVNDEAFYCLHEILCKLYHLDNIGLEFFEIGLNSKFYKNRDYVLYILEGRDNSAWPKGTIKLLKRTHNITKYEETKRRI